MKEEFSLTNQILLEIEKNKSDSIETDIKKLKHELYTLYSKGLFYKQSDFSLILEELNKQHEYLIIKLNNKFFENIFFHNLLFTTTKNELLNELIFKEKIKNILDYSDFLNNNKEYFLKKYEEYLIEMEQEIEYCYKNKIMTKQIIQKLYDKCMELLDKLYNKYSNYFHYLIKTKDSIQFYINFIEANNRDLIEAKNQNLITINQTLSKELSDNSNNLKQLQNLIKIITLQINNNSLKDFMLKKKEILKLVSFRYKEVQIDLR